MNKTRISIKEITIHILLWLTYILSEYFANLFHMRDGTFLPFLRSVLLAMPLLMIPTYFIALYAVPRFLKNDKILKFAITILIVAAFVFLARIKWLEIINYLEQGRYFKMPASKVLKNVIRDYAIIALAVCLYIISDWRKNQKRNEELIKAKAEAEIKLLKGQLHPHFLFNSLNNIYSLALMKSDLTADSILKLTELLDYLIYHANKEKVAISKEVQLLDNYLDLEKLRYDEKLKTQTDIHIRNNAVRIAPLMLLPFAENCFKHGGVSKDGFFWIRIKLHVDDHQLSFQIDNSKKVIKKDTHRNGGMGLENIRKRLILVYPGRHQLTILDKEDQFNVSLEIKLK